MKEELEGSFIFYDTDNSQWVQSGMDVRNVGDGLISLRFHSEMDDITNRLSDLYPVRLLAGHGNRQDTWLDNI